MLREFVLGLITENALAILELCHGRMTIPIPANLKQLAATAHPSQQSTVELEKRLWQLLRSAAASEPKRRRDA